jgi:two-component system OmpR family response regulator
MHRVLLIDDDEALAAPLAAYLKRFDLELEPPRAPAPAWRGWPRAASTR